MTHWALACTFITYLADLGDNTGAIGLLRVYLTLIYQISETAQEPFGADIRILRVHQS